MLFDRFVSIQGHHEGRKAPRSVSALKALSWRIVGTIDTLIIAWFITGEFTIALSIGGVEIISKMVLYYFHERTWERIIKPKKPSTP
jgi:uncharacterized membrane protein